MRSARVTTAFAIALATSGARASGPQDEPIRIEYRAPAGCPTEEAFVAQVRARSEHLNLVRQASEASRTFVVAVTPAAGDRIQAHLTIVDKATITTRDVTGSTCAEAVTAIALVTSLAIDEGSVPAPPPTATATRSPRAAVPPARWRADTGAQIALVSGVARTALLSVPFFFEVTRERYDGSVFAPSLRLGFEHAASGTFEAAGGSAQIDWTSAQVDACPFAFGHIVIFTACATGEIGSSHGSAQRPDLRPATPDSNLWLSAGARARLRWRFTGRLFADVDGGIAFRLVGPKFTVPDPIGGAKDVVFEAPPVGARVGVGVGAYLW
jgi:hypothetical protein